MNRYAPPRKLTPLGAASAMGGELQPLATARDVARQIEQCHKRLHRIHAVLLHLNIINQKNYSVGEFLDEAEHTFVQTLARYEARDFEGAREYIAASSALCWLTEILLSRNFRSTPSHEVFLPFHPAYLPAEDNREAVQSDLDRVERLLARVRWITQNGTLSIESLIQVERLSSWGQRLSQWARRLWDTGANRDAIEFARAAEAAVCSAEHLCRESYVTRSKAPQRGSASN
jgi:hypothetical protein